METLRLLGPLAWRNIWRNPRRTIITLIVVSVGVYSILFFASFIQAWSVSSRDRALTLMTGSAQIHAPGYLDDPTIDLLMSEPGPALQGVLNAPEIRGWTTRLSVPAVIQSEYRSMPANIVGVDPTREKTVSTVPELVRQGRYLNSPADGAIILGEKLLNRLKTRIGKRVIILAQGADGASVEQSFDVVGVYSGASDLENRFAFIGLDTAQKMLGAGGKLSEISLLVPEDENLTRVVARLQKAAPELDIRAWRDLSPMAAAIDQITDTIVYVWLWIMFTLMAIGIVNTQLMAVFERVREFGLLQALGMRPRMILLIVALESSILVGLGILLGMAMAVVTVRALSGGVDLSFFADATAMAGVGNALYPKIDARQYVQLSVVVWFLGIAVALWPARKAAKASPVEAMTHVS